MRKKIISREESAPSPARGLDIATSATVLVTSEDAEHPIENAFDGRGGPGASRWVAGEPGDQEVTLAFDVPQAIRRVVLEVEEREAGRTQEVVLKISQDGGRSYRDVVRQEYNFSPSGTTFEREEWSVPASGVTHLALWIRPDKGGGSSKATVTSLTVE